MKVCCPAAETVFSPGVGMTTKEILRAAVETAEPTFTLKLKLTLVASVGLSDVALAVKFTVQVLPEHGISIGTVVEPPMFPPTIWVIVIVSAFVLQTWV